MAGQPVGDDTDAPRDVRVIGDLVPGDHLCCIYETEDEHRAVLTPFLRQGLEHNEKVVYVADTHAADVVTGYLRDDGIDPGPYLAAGQLEILGAQEAYLRGGIFSPEGMIAVLRSETERALSDGYSALRVTGETAWVHAGQVEPERLVEYEVLINAFSPGSRCLAICQYDRRRIEPGVLLDVLRTHRYVAIGPDVCASPHFVPPGASQGAGRPAAELSGWLQDMVARRRQEDSLRNASLRLERILEATGAGTWEYNVQTGDIVVDSRWAEIVGYTLAELGGTGSEAWRTLTHPDDMQRADDLAERHRVGELPSYECAVRMRHKDGHWVWVQIRGRVLTHTGDGQPLMMFGTHADITEQLKADEDLRSAQARLRGFADANVIGVSVSRADGAILEANDYYLDLIGYSREELERGEADWRAVTSPEWLPVDEAAMEAFVGGGASVPYETEYLRRDGRRVAVLVSGYPLPGGDASTEFTLDITDRKAAEEQLRLMNEQLERRVLERTAKLEAANRELASFNYSASHDLRAPLRAINGYASLLRRRHGDTLDDESRRYLGEIETASERLGILIEELLDYSRLGRDGVRSEPVPLEPLVAELRTVFGERFTEAGGRLDLAEHPAVPLADPVLLERILVNLVENALVYRRADVVPTVTISAEGRGATVVVAVTDNGIGIPDAHQEKIFALFTRLHGEDEYSGTGIGLSIVRKAAILMGTNVMVESVEGEGSTFSLVLPAARGRGGKAGPGAGTPG